MMQIDAYVHDACICDIQSLTTLHVCMLRLKFCDQPTNQPTNEQGDSRSRMMRQIWQTNAPQLNSTIYMHLV